ncbi:hypothetical protein [Microbacterium esteraromaticum]|uniref:hypothetical protein n=1 Tax=Microbacterium esteraromaticum TaxID=57043 RepID=UPI0015F5C50E|nr:hypothetical protein [Microbacterium esteraromaticum]
MIAWIVGLHSSSVAQRFPELAIINAFDHRFTHALCPAQHAVVEHAMALVRQAVSADVDGLDLEAFGYLGWPHTGEHLKSGEALRPIDEWLLGLCFCESCRAGYMAEGLDADGVRQLVRIAIGEQLRRPRPASASTADDAVDALGEDIVTHVLAARAAVTAALVHEVVAAAEGVPVALRVTTDCYAGAGKSSGDLVSLAGLASSLTVSDLQRQGASLPTEVADLIARGITPERVDIGWSVGDGGQSWTEGIGISPRSVSLYAYDQVPNVLLARAAEQWRSMEKAA